MQPYEPLLNSPAESLLSFKNLYIQAAAETGTLWMTDVCNAVVKDGKIPEDWSKSWMVNVYKGKGDVWHMAHTGALSCWSMQ